MALSRDGASLAAADASGVIRVWHRGDASWREVAHPAEGAWSLAWSADRELVAGLDNGNVVRVGAGGALPIVARLGRDPVWALSFVADDAWLAAECDGEVSIVDARDGAEQRRWGDIGELTAVAGDWLLTGSENGAVTGWHCEAESGSCEVVAEFRTGPLAKPYGRFEAAAGEQGLWMVAMRGSELVVRGIDPDAEVARLFPAEGEEFRCVAASPAGTMAVATVRLDAHGPQPRVVLYDIGPLLAAGEAEGGRVEGVLAAVHGAFLESPPRGRVEWFRAFDRHLLRAEFPLCRALLDDIRGGPWNATAEELRYVDSREGALQLYQGVLHQRAGRLDQAAACYRQSLALQRRAGRSDAVTQAQRCLADLEVHRATGRCPTSLLTLGRRLQALRNPDGEPYATASEWLLAHRLETDVAPAARRDVLETALREGFWNVGRKALAAADPWTPVRGAAVLAQLHIPSREARDALVQVLGDGVSSFVRWRAAAALLALLEGDGAEPLSGDDFDAVHAAWKRESDPDVAVALLRLAASAGRPAVPLLLAALRDPDADVRLAAARELGQVGTREELAPLASAAWGPALLDLAHEDDPITDAIGEIEARWPALADVLSLRATVAGKIERPRAFEPDQPIVLRWDAPLPAAPLEVRVRWQSPDRGVVVAGATWETPSAGGSLPTGRVQRDPLVRPPAQTAGSLAEGTRVRARPGADRVPAGVSGTVVAGSPVLWGVAWDQEVGGHALGGRAAPGRGLYMLPEELEPITRSPFLGGPFSPGARVLMVEPDLAEGRVPAGAIGTVIEAGMSLGVEWDPPVQGHDLGGRCRPGHGWMVPEASLVPLLADAWLLTLSPEMLGSLAGPAELVLEGAGRTGAEPAGADEDEWQVLASVPVVRSPLVMRIVELTQHVGGTWGAAPGAEGAVIAPPLRRMVTRVVVEPRVPGGPVYATVSDGAGTEVGNRERTAAGTDEGVHFEWDTTTWAPGEYRVTVRTGSDGPRITRLTVAPPAHVAEAVLAREAGPAGLMDPVTSILRGESEALVVAARTEGGVPELLQLQVEVTLGDGRELARGWTTSVGAPPGWTTFVLKRPADGWSIGRHTVILRPVYPDDVVGEGSGGDSQPTTLKFEVFGG